MRQKLWLLITTVVALQCLVQTAAAVWAFLPGTSTDRLASSVRAGPVLALDNSYDRDVLLIAYVLPQQLLVLLRRDKSNVRKYYL